MGVRGSLFSDWHCVRLKVGGFGIRESRGLGDGFRVQGLGLRGYKISSAKRFGPSNAPRMTEVVLFSSEVLWLCCDFGPQHYVNEQIPRSVRLPEAV